MLDLYHRYSAISYCTSFSYKPLFDTEKRSNTEIIKQRYALRLPDHLNETHSVSVQHDSNEHFLNFTVENANDLSQNAHFQSKSIENMFQPENKSVLELANNNKRFNGSKSEMIETLGLHENQIFLGMISMQYKAKIVSQKVHFKPQYIKNLINYS